MRLIAIIAAGIVLGNLAWEFLLEAAHLTGRMVTKTIIDAARRSASRPQQVQPVTSDENDGHNIEFLAAQADGATTNELRIRNA
jgi:hypothetical protein